MLSRSILHSALSVVFVVAMGACGSSSGCAACASVQPLPGGKLPATQTVEGGAQIRLTPHGFSTLTSVLPGLINQQLAAGVCLPGGSTDGISYCQNNDGSCVKGCKVTPKLNSITVTPDAKNPQQLDVHVDVAASAPAVPVGALGLSCTFGVSVPHLTGDLNVTLGTNATTGELTVTAGPLTNFDFTDQSVTGCSILSSIVSGLVDILHGTLSNSISGLLSPTIDGLVNGFLPSPLGLVGTLDVGAALSSVAPGTQASLETRVVPGGYVHMAGGGLSLGVITGINADRDPTTRTGSAASEPALCVPPLTPPDLSAPPNSLTATSRGTFVLGVAPALDGAADPQADIAMGLSQTTLALAGHHLVTSGALCLQIGTATISQLNLGTIGLLVPSLAQLGTGQGNDPLLLVTRPQQDVTFAIGDNTAASPAVTVGLQHLQVDFYAFLFERYTRAFTLDLTLNVGVNVDLAQAGGVATVQPMLVGISPANIQVTVINSDFIRESPAQLEALLPSVFSLITPVIGNLPAITIPSFAGFSLNSPSIHHIATGQDDFLTLNASLQPSTAMRLANTDPQLVGGARAGESTFDPPVAASTARAQLIGVTTPSPDAIRSALMHQSGGAMPRVTFDADAYIAGAPVEWSYQLNGGMWRPWQQGQLVIEDEAFAWQGKYTVGLRSRIAGDYRTVSADQQVPVIIDSVAPRIAVDQASWNTDDIYSIPAFDIVSGEALQYGFGRPSATAPETPWAAGGKVQLSRATAESYAVNGEVAVFVKDEAGNVAKVVVSPLGQLAPEGCACQSNSAPGAGSLLLVLVVIGLLGRGFRRRRLGRHARTAGAAALTVMIGCGHSASSSATGTNNPPPPACETNSDCTLPCPSSQINFCVSGGCVCSDDIPIGRVGPYSHVAVGPDGSIWVSAYAQTYGDLVVAKASDGRIPDDAWEWVDGVPDGPVTVPGGKIRGGIDAAGPDTGMYTSIAVGPDGVPMVSYFDVDTASLKLAQKLGGAWQIHVVDAGTGSLGDHGELVGMFTSLTLRSDDGRPGIAYLAHVKDATGTRAEVRFASAQTPHPASAGDWQTWVVDTAPLPATDATSPAQFPLPDGLGLFVDSARMPNQAPVVAYYDRSSGDLKLAKFNVQSGQFAAAVVLDGSNGTDVGWTPSVAVDASGVVHVAYASATANDLKYTTDAAGAVPQVVDNGLRSDGLNSSGLPEPVFHFVGADASLVLPPGGAAQIAYQDATTQELLLAQQQTNGSWMHQSIAGATMPWPGGYGFYASAAMGQGQLVMSSWVIDQPNPADSNWVEVFSQPMGQ